MIENMRKSELEQSPEYEDGKKVELMISRLRTLANALKNDVFQTSELAFEAKATLDKRVSEDIAKLSSTYIPIRLSGPDVIVPNVHVLPFERKATAEDTGAKEDDLSGIFIGYRDGNEVRTLLEGEHVDAHLWEVQVVVSEHDDNKGFELSLNVWGSIDQEITTTTPFNGVPLIRSTTKQYAVGNLANDVEVRSRAVHEVESDTLTLLEARKKGIYNTGFGKKAKKLDSLMHHEVEDGWTPVRRVRILRELAAESYRLAELGPDYSKIGRSVLLRQMGRMRHLQIDFTTMITDTLSIDETVQGVLFDVILPESPIDDAEPAFVIGELGIAPEPRDFPVHIVKLNDITSLSL